MRTSPQFLLASLLLLPYAAFNQTLDPTFGTAGHTFVDFASDNDDAQELSILPDGRMLVSGYSYVSGDNRPAIARLLANGTLDPTFGTGGRTTLAIPGGAGGQAMTVRPDGKVLLAGNRILGASADLFVAQLLANGSLDPSFGIGGIAEITTFTAGAAYYDIALRPDGRIVLAGRTNDPPDSGIITVGLTVNGSLDQNFGTGGVAITQIGPFTDRALGLSIQPDGKILVAGNADFPGHTDLFVLRLSAAGLPDNTFGTNGSTIMNISNDEEFVADIELQSDGRIVVVGSARPNTDTDILAVRLLADGTPDPSFGTAGIVILVEINWAEADRVAIDSEGGIVLTCTVDGNNDEDIRLLRLFADGTPDPNYDAVFDVFNNDNSSAIRIQPDGKVVVAGENRNSEPEGDMLVMRFSAPGATSVNDLTPANLHVVITPNPVDRFFTLACDLPLLNGSAITVRDITGRLVQVTHRQAQGDTGTMVVDASDLSSGTYTITVRTAKGNTTARFVKQ